MEIRSFIESDKDNVAVLWRTVFPDSSTWNVPEDDIERKLTVQRESFYVAIVDGELVGTAMGGYDGHRGWLYYVAVHPEYRRQGIGTALVRRVESGLAEMGCPKVNLQVRATNAAVVDFYRVLGYGVEERVSMGRRLG
jgi:ribosomal protein S18 acetylase RimI-like enzyme